MENIPTTDEIREMEPEDRTAIFGAAKTDLDRHYRANCWDWLCEQVWTIDEADGHRKRWPAEKLYIRDLLAAVDEESMLAVPKSRRMMVSWAIAAWVTHRIRYFPNQAAFWQSENEDKAAFTVSRRCAYIEDNLTIPELRKSWKGIKTSKGETGRMTYDETGSYVWAIPQGADAIRAYTPSVLVMDECDFMESGPETLASALPILEKNAKLILISSSNGAGGVLAGICRGVGFARWS